MGLLRIILCGPGCGGCEQKRRCASNLRRKTHQKYYILLTRWSMTRTEQRSFRGAHAARGNKIMWSANNSGTFSVLHVCISSSGPKVDTTSRLIVYIGEMRKSPAKTNIIPLRTAPWLCFGPNYNVGQWKLNTLLYNNIKLRRCDTIFIYFLYPVTKQTNKKAL